MSAIALDLLQHLRESGVADDRALGIAELFDRRMKEALRDAKAHADRNRAETEQKVRSEFVSKDEYHARDKTLATRADLAETRQDLSARMEAGFAENRRDSRAIYRILIGVLIALIGIFLGLIGAGVAAIAKFYLGV